MDSKRITKILFLIYLLALSWIIIFKMQFSLSHLPHIRNLNLIPFRESVTVNGELYLNEVAENVLAFVPFGIFMAMLLPQKRFAVKAAPVFAASLFYESTQFLFAIGASDITDLIGNTLGGIMGIGIFYLLTKILGERAYKIVNILLLAGAAGMLLLIGLLVVLN